jgi:oligoribonuclease (3'-5' exoribonuclease)
MLQLKRPIAFIDLETTGVSLSSDRIVEIAIIKIMPDGSRQVKENSLILKCLFRKNPAIYMG